MLRGVHEVLIGAEKNEVVPDAELRDQGIDGSNLYTGPATCVSHACRSHMVFAVGLNQCQRSELLDDLFAGLGTREALKKFLQHQTGRDNNVCASKRVLQRLYLGLFNLNVASEGKRPDARIDQERHFRERSAL
jgi:hypothetical protein